MSFRNETKYNHIELPITLAIDHSVAGITKKFIAGVALNFGDVCYIDSAGKARLVDADAIATSSGYFMCADTSIGLNELGNFLWKGIARDDTWNWTPGALLYITVTGTTGNTISASAPSETGDVIQIIGQALTADILAFDGNLVQIEHE